MVKVMLVFVIYLQKMFEVECDEVMFFGGEGEMGVFLGYIGFILMIVLGLLSYCEGGVDYCFVVFLGFCEMSNDILMVFVDCVQKVEEIDVDEVCKDVEFVIVVFGQVGSEFDEVVKLQEWFVDVEVCLFVVGGGFVY